MEREILESAIATFGNIEQIDMLIEEMAELIVALQHYKRGRTNNVTEELADVEIMIKQVKIIAGEADVDLIKHTKLKRLEKRINEVES